MDDVTPLPPWFVSVNKCRQMVYESQHDFNPDTILIIAKLKSTANDKIISCDNKKNSVSDIKINELKNKINKFSPQSSKISRVRQ